LKNILTRAACLVPLIFVAACNTTTADVGATSSVDASRAAAGPGIGLQRGHASWYGPGFHGRRTASGETFNSGAMTAAHRSLPFGTRVRVVHEGNGRSVVVRINDRGPFHRGRIIDLAHGPARALGLTAAGSAYVSLHRMN
jgi:rare lipoprotein A